MAPVIALLIVGIGFTRIAGGVYWEPTIRLPPSCRGFPLHRQTG